MNVTLIKTTYCVKYSSVVACITKKINRFALTIELNLNGVDIIWPTPQSLQYTRQNIINLKKS